MKNMFNNQEKTMPSFKKIKEQIRYEDAREKGMLFHTSPNKITKIYNDRMFGDVLFFSSTPYFMSGRSEFLYAVDKSRLDFLKLSSIPYHTLNQVAEKLLDEFFEEVTSYNEADLEDTDELLDYISENKSFFDLISSGEIASELSWRSQYYGAKIAEALGYDGVQGMDEQGAVWMIPMMGRENILLEVDDYFYE